MQEPAVVPHGGFLFRVPLGEGKPIGRIRAAVDALARVGAVVEHGIHFCLGYQLARLEGKCALEALFKRWPKLALAIPVERIRWRPRPGLRAIETPVVAA
jgi:cytochrome P450